MPSSLAQDLGCYDDCLVGADDDHALRQPGDNLLQQGRIYGRVRSVVIHYSSTRQPLLRHLYPMQWSHACRRLTSIMPVGPRYGRTVGRVYLGTLDASAEMVRQGAA
jgi:hypothetical protein